MRNLAWMQSITLCIVATGLLSGCSTLDTSLSSSLSPSQYHYPYLSQAQVSSLSQYETIGILPAGVVVPQYEQAALERELNADSDYQASNLSFITKLNSFLASKAREQLGCGALKKNTMMTIPAGIYRFEDVNISFDMALRLILKQPVQSLCVPSSLPAKFTPDQPSVYWSFIFSSKQVSM